MADSAQWRILYLVGCTVDNPQQLNAGYPIRFAWKLKYWNSFHSLPPARTFCDVRKSAELHLIGATFVVTLAFLVVSAELVSIPLGVLPSTVRTVCFAPHRWR